MAEYWLDYSAAKLSGATIRNTSVGPAGEKATGVIRYIDAPNLLGTKHTSLAEYRDHIANGLQVRLVHQGTTTDADGGYDAGRNRAIRAKAGADYLGYGGPIFFCNDRTTVPNAAAWRAYLDGAASVLGVGRVGAYGFFNAMDLAVGHASFFWQAGRRSDVRGQTNAWQDNNTQVTVGGITCDRNLILKAIAGDTNVALDQNDLNSIKGIVDGASWWYGPRFRGNENYAQVVTGAAADSATAKADVKAALAAVAALAAKVDGLQSGGVDLDALAAKVAAIVGPTLAGAVADELNRRLAS